MKKIILPILIFSLFLSCSKDDNSSSSESRMKDSAITNIFATGKVSEQSASEAKKTIFGKWNVGAEKIIPPQDQPPNVFSLSLIHI